MVNRSDYELFAGHPGNPILSAVDPCIAVATADYEKVMDFVLSCPAGADKQ